MDDTKTAATVVSATTARVEGDNQGLQQLGVITKR
jgi:hypothetical protein